MKPFHHFTHHSTRPPKNNSDSILDSMLKNLSHGLLISELFICVFNLHVSAQTNSGNSTGANSGAASSVSNISPSAAISTQTTGGTNINYQTNNQWSNDIGFGGGIVCRTPTFYGGVGNAYQSGQTNSLYLNSLSNSNTSNNINANFGILIPFGSSVLDDCKTIAAQIAIDRKISTDLSMIRACASLQKEGIKVDPTVYPYLAKCTISVIDIPKQSTKEKEKSNPNPSDNRTALPQHTNLNKKTKNI